MKLKYLICAVLNVLRTNLNNFICKIIYLLFILRFKYISKFILKLDY